MNLIAYFFAREQQIDYYINLVIAFTFVNMSKNTSIYHLVIYHVPFGWISKRIAVQGGSPMMKAISVEQEG